MACGVSPCCPLRKLSRKLGPTVNGHVVPPFVVTWSTETLSAVASIRKHTDVPETTQLTITYLCICCDMSPLLWFKAVRRFMMLWLHYLPGGWTRSIGNTSLTSRTHHWRRWSAPLTSRCVRRLQFSQHMRGRRSGPAEYSTQHWGQLGGSEWGSRVGHCGCIHAWMMLLKTVNVESAMTLCWDSEIIPAVEEQRNCRWMQITDYESIGEMNVRAISMKSLMKLFH